MDEPEQPSARARVARTLSADAGWRMLAGGTAATGVLAVAEGPFGRLALPASTAGIARALERLFSGGDTEDALAALCCRADGPASLPELYLVLERLRAAGALRVVLHRGPDRWATSLPSRPPSASPSRPPRRTGPPRLCRHASLAVGPDGWVLDSPLAWSRVVISHPEAWALLHGLGGLAGGSAAGDMSATSPDARTAPGPAGADADALVRLLDDAGLLEDGGGSGPAEGWERHDLLFHARTRYGRHRDHYGRRPEPSGLGAEPAVDATPCPEPSVRLPPPRPLPERATLAAVLAHRRSVRGHTLDPLTAAELGDVLHHAAGPPAGPASSPNGRGVGHRPYPSGGAGGELALYPLVRACAGVRPGLYRFEAAGHALLPVAGMTPDVKALLASVPAAWGVDAEPQVLIVVTARFGALQARYGSVAYATVLKNLGALYQTLYLVATAFELAPCALGGGNADVFARAAGLDYLVEGSVGEFTLGRPRAP